MEPSFQESRTANPNGMEVMAGVWNPVQKVVEWQKKWHHGVAEACGILCSNRWNGKRNGMEGSWDTLIMNRKKSSGSANGIMACALSFTMQKTGNYITCCCSLNEWCGKNNKRKANKLWIREKRG